MLTEGIVDSYDAVRREIRVKIAETAKSDIQPLAQMWYPMGDDPADTEIEIKVGAKVWCIALADDSSYLLIIGYRCPQTGNLIDIRRIRQKNIELLAVQELKGGGATILYQATSSATLEAPAIDLIGQTTMEGSAEITGALRVATGRTVVATTPTGDLLTFFNGILVEN